MSITCRRVPMVIIRGNLPLEIRSKVQNSRQKYPSNLNSFKGNKLRHVILDTFMF